MIQDIIYIDNVFENPDSIVELASKQQYFLSDENPTTKNTKISYSGVRTLPLNNILAGEPPQTIDIKQFVHTELIHFSNYDNIRSIPSICDGFKPSLRKILYGSLKSYTLETALQLFTTQ